MRCLSVFAILLLAGCAGSNSASVPTTEVHPVSARASANVSRARATGATALTTPVKKLPNLERETDGRAPQATTPRSDGPSADRSTRPDSSRLLSEKTPSIGSPEWEREERIKEERERRIKDTLRGICRGC